MSKRNKKSRSIPSAFKLEALEQRQLLATIVAGSGHEVDGATDVELANGNTYDQVLMTGSTVTVTSDWNAEKGAYDVTRVDFLDADGDLVRAEFAGPGQLTISLADFKEAAPPEFYATDVEYVQGVANFRITGSTEVTNFSVHSLGTVNVHNGAANPIFDGGEKTGGDNWANVSRVVIESDGGALGNAFGGIRAGNAVFSGDTGAVGIIAPEVQFFGPIIIGGIEASDDAIAMLQIGQFSSNKVVTLAGTDLDGDIKIDVENISGLIMASGQSSMGEIVDTKVYKADAFQFDPIGEKAALEDDITYTSSALTVTLDEDTTTEDLAALKLRFLSEVVIEKSFADSDDFADFTAMMIGNVTVKGDLNFKIAATELSMGDVTVEGSILAGGQIVAEKSIGNVTVVGDIDFTEDSYSGGDALISSTTGDIGDVTFEGDIAMDTDDNVALVVATAGSIGKVSGGKLESTETDTVIEAQGDIGDIEFSGVLSVAGAILAGGSIGNISGDGITTAAISADEGSIGDITSDDDLSLGAVTSAEGVGSISGAGDVTLAGIEVDEGDIGDISAGGSLTISGDVTATDGDIGDISTEDGSLTLEAVVNASGSIGNISVAGDEAGIVIDATDDVAIVGDDGDGFVAGDSIGNVTVAAGSITSGNTSTAEFTANVIGDVSVTGHEDSMVLLDDVIFAATGDDAAIGDITLDASAMETAGAHVAASTGASLTAVTGTGFSSNGNIGDVSITAHEDASLLDANTSGLVIRAGNSNMGADVAGNDETVSIGDVTIEVNLAKGLGNGAGTGLIIASGVDAIDHGVFVSGTEDTVTAPEKDGSGSIGALTITDVGGSGVTGFNSNTLATGEIFTGGSAIVANSIGAITIEAGDSVTTNATGTARKGAFDIDKDSKFTTDNDLFIVIL